MRTDLNVCYSGFWTSASGMGEACRNFILSLKNKVHLTTEVVPNIKTEVDLGEGFSVAKKLHGRDVNFNFKIIHVTPDIVWKHMTPYVYNIFRLAWETDRLPREWVWMLNHSVDEVWTGAEYHKKCFEESGVKVPIHVFPEPIDTKVEAKPFQLNGGEVKDFKGFKFYSIFEWIERKNPKALLQAYWREFQGEDKVGLVIKTYREKVSQEKMLQIINDIQGWKKELSQSHFPKVFLYTNMLSRHEVMRLHATGDCFVSANRIEGWGIPIAEAMVMGKPVISTGRGGIMEHIPEKTALKVKYQMCNVFNMEWAKWYSTDQKWAEVDQSDLRKKMRGVFNHQNEAKELGKKGQLWAKKNLSYNTVGKKIVKRLEEIEGSLH